MKFVGRTLPVFLLMVLALGCIAEDIGLILKNHTVADSDLDESVLLLLAGYYSAFPEVRELFLELKDSSWVLKRGYAEHKTVFLSRGLFFQEQVVIYFSPDTGARVRFENACSDKINFCYVSPADILVHELLHARMMLSLGYERTNIFKEERIVLSFERFIYSRMTELDGFERPVRSRSRGEFVAVDCLFCLPQGVSLSAENINETNYNRP